MAVRLLRLSIAWMLHVPLSSSTNRILMAGLSQCVQHIAIIFILVIAFEVLEFEHL